MHLIVGLGNPGKKYEETRHNLGWQAIDELARIIKSDDWQNKPRLKAEIATASFGNTKIILAKPQTFMNKSGLAVKLLMDYYKTPLDSLLIIHDELDLPLDEVKLQKNRGPAGHHGVESVIQRLKTKDFSRIRIGIKPMTEIDLPTEEFVLQKFGPSEKLLTQKAIQKAADIIIDKFLR